MPDQWEESIPLAKEKDRELREGWNNLIAFLQSGDEVWEWEWHAHPRIDFRASYSLGFCVIRNGAIVYSYAHSYS